MTPLSVLFRAIFYRGFSILQRWFYGLLHFVQRLGVEEGEYAFTMEVTEDELLLYRTLYQTYLRRFPNRYTAPSLARCPEVDAATQQLERRQLEDFTVYVVAQMQAERERFDYQYYAVAYSLLAGLLQRRPWAARPGMLRVGEALFFTSPFGFDGVIYWPIADYLRAVLASHGGQPVSPDLRAILEMMQVEIRRYFAYGFTDDVTEAQRCLGELLHPVCLREQISSAPTLQLARA
ncbi:hypothetical protein [Lewinella sp. W8]|uniref:hypothetical protein n=1 Tax=Lewinella sp. W8 TaxID=2528208 RepID=UPI00106772CF|nr:hypothetical protein [Lewinella sp. W8]MTB51196.1 hypothetical protein [Lewinella sp. W8]